MIEQIEFANVVVLNKTDLVSADQVQRAEDLVKVLNSYVFSPETPRLP